MPAAADLHLTDRATLRACCAPATVLTLGLANLRLWANRWQPVMKLIGKERVGAKLRKCYDVARTRTSLCAPAVISLFLGDGVSRPSTTTWVR